MHSAVKRLHICILGSIFAKNVIALWAEMCDIIPFRATTTGNASTWPTPETYIESDAKH